MAKHVYYYLSERADTLWEQHKPIAAYKGEKGLGAKTAFISNMLMSLCHKLSDAEKERTRNSPKIVYVKPGAERHSLISVNYINNDQKLNIYEPISNEKRRDGSIKGYLD
jgi:hypothetical protein